MSVGEPRQSRRALKLKRGWGSTGSNVSPLILYTEMPVVGLGRVKTGRFYAARVKNGGYLGLCPYLPAGQLDPDETN